MGSLVLTVGTGSTWAMRAAQVLAMSGLTFVVAQYFFQQGGRTPDLGEARLASVILPGTELVADVLIEEDASTVPKPQTAKREPAEVH